jgi:hypothetical protein
MLKPEPISVALQTTVRTSSPKRQDHKPQEAAEEPYYFTKAETWLTYMTMD